ncbi:MAG: lytic transglycosylase domain-containing protein [Thermoanaerobaculia bacterium]
MSRGGRARGRGNLSAPALLALALALPAASRWPPPAAAETTTPAVATASWESLFAAGEAARRGGLPAARAALSSLLASGDELAAARARTLLGLIAQVRGESREALPLLSGPGLPELEDWRLFALAEAAAADGKIAAAEEALGTLLAATPDSPLRAPVTARLAELAWQRRDAAAALARIAEARREAYPLEVQVRCERLAWQIGRATANRDAARSAARRLLVLAPLEAAKLGVAEALRPASGAFDWAANFSSAELEQRATALLAADLADNALGALAAVPPAARDFAWSLLEARALTAAGHGVQALANLTTVSAADALGEARLAWTRAMAAVDAGTARRGQGSLGANARAYFRSVARGELERVVAAGADRDLARDALRLLFVDLLADDRFDEALARLTQLRALDPADRSGSRPLWEKGWEEYRAANFSGAIGVWSELFALDPASNFGRSARYWTARAYEKLHETERADEIYRELAAADTTDFYADQAALRRAGGAAIGERAAVEREAWPESREIRRSRLLTDLGLDAFAATELALVRDRADGRAATALDGLILARQGDRRESLRLLRKAFPDLATAHQAAVPAEALALFYPLDFREPVARYAVAARLPVPLVFGMIHQESAFDASAKSRSGARGLMQLMPATGRELARRLGMPFSLARLNDPDYSVRLGTTYFRQVLDAFHGNVELALAAYNGGPGRIRRLWQASGGDSEIDRFVEQLGVEESRNYVKRILVLANSYRKLYPDLG